MNRVELLGRLTKDAEIRTGKNGKGKDAVEWKSANFTLAVDRANNREKTDFISCTAWSGLADLIEKYVHKGDLLAIEGTIETRSYEDEDGKTVYRTDVRVTGLDLLPNNRKSEEEEEEPKSTRKASRYGR